MNAENIAAMLRDERHAMTQLNRLDTVISIQANKPLFINGNGGENDTVISYSLLTGGNPRIFSTYGLIAQPRRGYFSTCTNLSISQLYALAYSNVENEYGSLVSLPIDRVVVDVRDSTQLVPYVRGELIRDNLYVYQLLSPPVTRAALQEKMQEDLKRYFGLKVSWEKRKVRCLVLKAADTVIVSYRGGEREKWIDEFKFKLNRVPAKEGWSR